MEVDTLYHGSGLGLWLLRRIVDSADGTVSVAENEPRGNIVTIHLTPSTTAIDPI